MKAFVTSIGERTTQICCEQLEKFGFKVILLDKKEPWLDKYKRFIEMAKNDCFRVDADVIPNSNILLVPDLSKEAWTIQNWVFDFYKNDMTLTSPIFYRKRALDEIRKNLDKLSSSRPEASALRLPEVNKHICVGGLILGSHGLFQDSETIERAKKHKVERGQLEKYKYDFGLVYKLKKLGWD